MGIGNGDLIMVIGNGDLIIVIGHGQRLKLFLCYNVGFWHYGMEKAMVGSCDVRWSVLQHCNFFFFGEEIRIMERAKDRVSKK